MPAAIGLDLSAESSLIRVEEVFRRCHQANCKLL
jgi:hypothetical protein